MPFTMTPNEALTIQRAHIVWYRQMIGRAGLKAIRKRTTLPNVNPDVPVPVSVINEHIPRGGSFERYILRDGPEYNVDLTGEAHHLPSIRPGANDPDTLAWHDAIRRGFV